MAYQSNKTIRHACYKNHFSDAIILPFGDADDVTMQWDGTNFIVSAAADDSLIEIGDSATTQLSFDLKWYANEASGASYLYGDASANLLYTTGIDVQIKDDDFLVFGTGAGATGDVQIEWDTAGTDALRITATADDTPIEIGNGTNSFDITIFGNVAGDYLLWDASDSKLEAYGAACIEWGVSGTPLVKDTAGTNFWQLYTDCGATSGDSRGLYIRHDITGAGSGEALRAFGRAGAANVATGGTANGAHISFSESAGSSISGQSNAARLTYGVADEAKTMNGNSSVLLLESDIGTQAAAHANNAFIRCLNLGAGTGIKNLLRVPNVASGGLLAVHTTDAVTHSIRVCSEDGTKYYLMATTTITNRTGGA